MNSTERQNARIDNAPQAPSRFRNFILRSLPEDVIERLDLTAVPLPAKRELEFIGNEIGHVFFIESGVGSMTMTFSDGAQVEVGLFGFDAAIGISALMGTRRSLNRIFMQAGGHGYVCRVKNAKEEFNKCGAFQQMALGYVQAQLNQATISAACNLRHSVSQRLARWLLLCLDRTKENGIGLSQEFLAMMLGARRTTVTFELGELVAAGVIAQQRMKIELVDRKALETRSCECYSILSRYLNDPQRYDAGFAI